MSSVTIKKNSQKGSIKEGVFLEKEKIKIRPQLPFEGAKGAPGLRRP